MRKTIALAIILTTGVLSPACTPQASPVHSSKIIHPELIRGIVHVESRGNPKAVSNKGAIGLMQIMPLWVPELRKKGILRDKQDLFHPEKNIRAGKYILAKYIKKHGNVEKALEAYSGGAKGYRDKVTKYMRER